MKADSYMQNPKFLACLEEKLPPTTRNYWIHYKAECRRKNANILIAEFEEWTKPKGKRSTGPFGTEFERSIKN